MSRLISQAYDIMERQGITIADVVEDPQKPTYIDVLIRLFGFSRPDAELAGELIDELFEHVKHLEAELDRADHRLLQRSNAQGPRQPNRELREFVIARDSATCRYCLKPVPVADIHIDHVYPYSKGGATVEENLVVACAPCNHSKNDRVGIWPKMLERSGK